MTVKLHINISQGVIDVEGDADLVRTIYADFKDQLLKGVRTGTADAAEQQASSEGEILGKPKAKPKRRSNPKRKANSENGSPTVMPDQPKLDKNLDTSGLASYYNQYEPKNNPEKILIFLKFMNDELDIEAPNTDQFFTCYEKVNERVPKAFSQAFRDASGKNFGYIDYNSPTDIRLTTAGINHFKFDLKKKASE